jgi:hypothetical protein
MEINGKLIQVTTPETKTGKNNKEYISCLAIIETSGDYPKKVAISLGKAELIDKVKKFSIGSEVTFSINLESREYNGKYFHNINAWSVK